MKTTAAFAIATAAFGALTQAAPAADAYYRGGRVVDSGNVMGDFNEVNSNIHGHGGRVSNSGNVVGSGNHVNSNIDARSDEVTKREAEPYYPYHPWGSASVVDSGNVEGDFNDVNSQIHSGHGGRVSNSGNVMGSGNHVNSNIDARSIINDETWVDADEITKREPDWDHGRGHRGAGRNSGNSGNGGNGIDNSFNIDGDNNVQNNNIININIFEGSTWQCSAQTGQKSAKGQGNRWYTCKPGNNGKWYWQ